MNGFSRFREWFRDRLHRSHTRPVPRWERWLWTAVEFPLHCARELRHDKAGQMAAALTYHTLFSLLPTLVLAMVALHNFASEEDRNHFKDRVIEYSLRALSTETRTEETTGPDPQTAEFEETRRNLTLRIQNTMDRIDQLSFQSIGLVGVLVFIYSSTALLSTVERSFNSIFGVRKSRPWYLRLPIYYTVITLGPLVILAGEWIQGRLVENLQASAGTSWLAGIIAAVSPFPALWAAIFLVFITLPNTRVLRRAALVGSLISALLLSGCVELYQWYVQVYTHNLAVEMVYGALALLPLTLLWLFLMWLVVLFGLEITFSLQALQGRRFKYQAPKITADMLLDPGWILPVAVEVARGHERGSGIGVDELERTLHLSLGAVRRLLDALAQADLVRTTDNSDRQIYTLTSPADEISIRQVLDVARALSPHPSASRNKKEQAWRFMQQIERIKNSRTRGKTLADFC